MNYRFTLGIVSAITLSACAVTYQAPTEQNQNYSSQHGSTQAEVLANAKRTLLLEGFQIQSSDDSAGFISTAPKNWRLTPEQASCGTTMGIDYLKDNRTKTEVAINVIADSANLTIRSNIQGEYKPGAVDQDITLSCVSRGVIERELANKILK